MFLKSILHCYKFLLKAGQSMQLLSYKEVTHIGFKNTAVEADTHRLGYLHGQLPKKATKPLLHFLGPRFMLLWYTQYVWGGFKNMMCIYPVPAGSENTPYSLILTLSLL